MAVLIWYYTLLMVIGAIAGMVLMVAAVYVLFIANLMYSRMRSERQRNHGHVWMKLALYLGITGGLCIAMPVTGIILTFVITFVLQCVFGPRSGAKTAEEGSYIQGDARQVGTQMAKRRARQGDSGMAFGGVRTSTRDATKNYLFAGTVGSGKSVSIQLLMLQALGGIGSEPTNGNGRKRAVIYDPAGETPAMLEAMGFPPSSIILTHPFDQRSRSWAIAEDIRTADHARELGRILIEPNPKATDPYWDNSARNVLVAVVRYFNIVAPKRFTFRDLLMASRSESFIRLILQDEPKLAHLLAGFGSDKTSANIMATLITQLDKYEVIAALWHKSETVYGNKPFSLTRWASGSSILVLGRSATSEAALKSVNRILLTRLIQLLMEAPLSSIPLIWLFLDELGSLGGFKPLLTAVTELRKRGVAIVVGFQSLSHVVENFNEHVSNTILANFNHIAGLRLSDAKTEEWLRQIFGKVRFSRLVQSTSHNHNQGRSRTVSQTHGEEDVLRPGVMGDIPIFDPANGIGLTGVYKAGDLKWWNTYPPSIVGELPPQGDPRHNFIPMPEEYQELEPWTYADYQRLNIEHLYDGPIEDILADALPGQESTLALDGASDTVALPKSGVPLDIGQLRALTADADGVSASDYLEQQFQKFEQQYGITFGDDADASKDSDIGNTK
ncbi:MAG: type IV secretion system DNA-binding domain-containing protein [Pontixanthobacter sp.]